MDTLGIDFIVASGVANPLYAPPARVFGPQKGPSAWLVEALHNDMQKRCDRLDLHGYASLPGAAGGAAFALLAFFNASLRSGLDAIAEAVRLDERLRGADLCFTGEGRFDQQSLADRATIGVTHHCRDTRRSTTQPPCSLARWNMSRGCFSPDVHNFLSCTR